MWEALFSQNTIAAGTRVVRYLLQDDWVQIWKPLRQRAHFGANRVFMDVEGIEPGLDFVDAIEEAVSSCRVLIAVIGDEWTSSADAAGRRRSKSPDRGVSARKDRPRSPSGPHPP